MEAKPREFEWMKPVGAYGRNEETRAMREGELAHRALVLARLGYSVDEVEARLQDNLAWEYELVGNATGAKRLSAIVAEAFTRAGRPTTRRAKKKSS